MKGKWNTTKPATTSGITIDKTQGCWKTGQKRVEKCDMLPDKKLVIVIPLSLHQTIMAITKEMKNLEWLCYGQFKIEGNKGQLVNIVVPEQTVTAGSVVVDKPDVGAEFNGTLHRHPGSSTFLSGIDDEYIGGNHTLTISFNDKGEYRGKMKHTLPCGGTTLLDIDVAVFLPEVKGLTETVKAALGKIFEYIAPATTTGYPCNYGGVDDYDMTYVCGHCRKSVPMSTLKWINNIGVCKECHDKVIAMVKAEITK